MAEAKHSGINSFDTLPDVLADDPVVGQIRVRGADLLWIDIPPGPEGWILTSAGPGKVPFWAPPTSTGGLGAGENKKMTYRAVSLAPTTIATAAGTVVRFSAFNPATGLTTVDLSKIRLSFAQGQKPNGPGSLKISVQTCSADPGGGTVLAVQPSNPGNPASAVVVRQGAGAPTLTGAPTYGEIVSEGLDNDVNITWGDQGSDQPMTIPVGVGIVVTITVNTVLNTAMIVEADFDWSEVSN